MAKGDMEEKFLKNLRCPACNELVYTHKNMDFEMMHYTKYKFDYGFGNFGQTFGTDSIKYCHVSNLFIHWERCGSIHSVRLPETTQDAIKRMIEKINEDETDMRYFLTKYEFNKHYNNDMDFKETRELYRNLDNIFYKNIKSNNNKTKKLRCKLGFHKFGLSKLSDILLVCDECNNTKIDWRRLYENIITRHELKEKE